MTLPALLLVLLSAVAHAAWNRRLHVVEDRLAVMAVAGLASGAVLLPALLWRPPTGVWPLVVLSGLVEAAYCVLLSAAYARGSLAVAYPIGRGTAPLLVTVFGAAVLGQRPAPVALLGAALVGAGLVVVAGVARSAGQGAAVGWALATGCAIATYSLIDARAMSVLGSAAAAPGYLGAEMFVQTGALVAVLAVRRATSVPARLRAAARQGAAVGIGMTLAYGLVVTAFALAPAGRVATLRESSVLLAVALSPERRRRRVWVGAALVVAGAVAVAL